MNTPIKTNKLSARLDRTALDNAYSIFLVATSEKYFKHGAYILDAPLLCNAVKAVYYESGKAFYIMMDKADGNMKTLQKVVLEAEGGDCVTISSVEMTAVKDHIITQLLLNALGTYNLSFMRFNNLSGHLYCFQPKWIRKSKKHEKQEIMKIPCLEIAVSYDMRVSLYVRTFTSVLLRKSITFGKRQFHEYPQYVFGANNTLRRKLKGDNDASFIMRQTDGDKTTIPFLDIQSKELFDMSKMGVLASVLSEFNKKYDGLCYIEFFGISDYSSIDCTRTVMKENRAIVSAAFTALPIKIVDEIGDEYSARFCSDMKDTLEEQYSVKATIGKRYARNALNIGVIHNAAYYAGVDDPHTKQREGMVIQHVTLEDFQGSSKFALSTVIHEILIKNDIVSRKISLFDWGSIGIKDCISFGIRTKTQDDNRYFFMKIAHDGTFDFYEQKLDLFEANEYSECVSIFEDAKDVCGIIKMSNGDINIIRNTGWFTIPEIEAISQLLSEGDNHLRGKARKEELLPSVLDIKMFDEAEAKYYFVGTIGEGMQARINCAANIRKIEPYKNATLMFDELLPLMNVTFIHNGQLTVMPFPFKYLREYCLTI